MQTVSISPADLVLGTLQTLCRAGIDAALTTTNVHPAIAAATDLLRVLGVPATPAPEPATTPATTHQPAAMGGYRLGDPAMWARADMRTALARRDVGAVYRILGRFGISQRRIAAATGQSQSEISEIVSGRQVVSYDVLVRIADGLGVPREHMGLARGPAPATPQSEGDEEGQQVRDPALLPAAPQLRLILGHRTQSPTSR